MHKKIIIFFWNILITKIYHWCVTNHILQNLLHLHHSNFFYSCGIWTQKKYPVFWTFYIISLFNNFQKFGFFKSIFSTNGFVKSIETFSKNKKKISHRQKALKLDKLILFRWIYARVSGDLCSLLHSRQHHLFVKSVLHKK